MTNDERDAIVISLQALEPLTALIPPPGNVMVLMLLHGLENDLKAGKMPDTEQLAAMRLTVYNHLQDRIQARFAPVV